MDNIFKKIFAKFGGLSSTSKSFQSKFINLSQLIKKTNYDEIIIFYFLESVH